MIACLLFSAAVLAFPVPSTDRNAPSPTRTLVAGLDDEATILGEAESDPRNLQPDAIPVIRGPVYVAGRSAAGMDPGEWVVGVEIAGQPLAFPVNALNQHEIVIDAIDGVPFMVCWCPLCRTGTVFHRRLGSREIDFGHSGMLYRNAFLLYELGTSALWHHATGEALTGSDRGRRLEPIPCRFVKWEVWAKAHPETRVLAKEPGDPDDARDSYAARNRSFLLTYGLGVSVNGAHKLYEFSQLKKTNLVRDEVAGEPIVVYRDAATETAVAWKRTLDGRLLELQPADDATQGPQLKEAAPDGSVFDAVTGKCVKGRLLGRSLVPVLSSFWEVFAWQLNHPGGTEYRAD